MANQKPQTAQDPGVEPALAVATYKVVGIDDGVTEVYVPQLCRSYVLADITPAQFELLHRMGWPHVEKVY